jgi:hypothetical protein
MPLAVLLAAAESEGERRNTLSTSGKIDAVWMSSVWRSRWKSNFVRPAKITRPATAAAQVAADVCAECQAAERQGDDPMTARTPPASHRG